MQGWWFRPPIPTFRKQNQKDKEFEARLRGCRSVVEFLQSMYMALGSNISIDGRKEDSI
jgi:hypothetical protein